MIAAIALCAALIKIGKRPPWSEMPGWARLLLAWLAFGLAGMWPLLISWVMALFAVLMMLPVFAVVAALDLAIGWAVLGAVIGLIWGTVKLCLWLRRKTHSREANTSSPRTARPTVHARQEADLASPLPDDLIAEGREFMATAEGATESNQILAEYGLPSVGEHAIYQSDVFSEDGRASRSTPERVVVLDAIPSEEYMSGESTPPAVTIWRDGTTFELILPLSGETLTPFHDRS